MIEEKEINLSSILTVIWERGKRITIFTIVCFIIGVVTAFSIKNRYEGVAYLQMNISKLGERTMERPPTPMRTYEMYIANPVVQLEIIKKYHLNEKPYKFKYPQDLGRRMGISYLENTALLKVYVELEDPALAADVANDLASKAVETANKLMGQEQLFTTSEFAKQSNRLYIEAERLKKVYLDSLLTNMKPVHMQELNNYMTLYAAAVQQKDTLDASLVELERKKNVFESEVFSASSDYKQKVQLRRAVVTDPLLIEHIREQKGASVNLDDLKDIVFYEESLDPYYNQLLMEYKSLIADIPSLTAKRDFLDGRIKQLQTDMENTQKRIFEMDVDELVTKGDYDRAMEIYSGIYKEEGWAGTTIASERQELVVVEKAVPLMKKVYPKRSLIIGLTGFSGFLLSFLYYLLFDLYGLLRLQKRTNAA